MTEVILKTVGNRDWLVANRGSLLMLFPETWTHVANINLIAVRYRLKLMGVDFRSEDEFAQCLAQLEINKILLRDGLCLRRGKAD
jgi:hypothetical protein